MRSFKVIWIFFLLAPLFILLLFIFRYSPVMEFLTLCLAVLAYLLLTVLHHLQDKTLTLEIMIEYILIAALVLIVFQGLML